MRDIKKVEVIWFYYWMEVGVGDRKGIFRVFWGFFLGDLMMLFVEMGILRRGVGLREKVMNLVWNIYLVIFYEMFIMC